jgi:outer membrane murein-binding lipoprotein Lpp
MNPKRVESDSMPPIDVSRSKMLVPLGVIAIVLAATLATGRALEKIPDDAKVEAIATRVSEKTAREAVLAADSRHERETEELKKTQAETARVVARQSVTLAKLLAYQEAQTIERLRPGYQSPQAQMRRNVSAGRDPLEGIVPTETRD